MSCPAIQPGTDLSHPLPHKECFTSNTPLKDSIQTCRKPWRTQRDQRILGQKQRLCSRSGPRAISISVSSGASLSYDVWTQGSIEGWLPRTCASKGRNQPDASAAGITTITDPGLKSGVQAPDAVAQAMAEFEPMCMAPRPEDATEARSLPGKGVDLFEVPLDDSRARDAGPDFVVDGKGNKATSLSTFSTWGHKHAPFDKDAALGAAVAVRKGLPVFGSSLPAEGGGVTADGPGTIIATDTCLLNPNRNPTCRIRSLHSPNICPGGGGIHRIPRQEPA